MSAPETGTQHQIAPPTHLFAPEVAPPRVPGYEIGEKLGEGGMGVVYAARDLVLVREVAVKVMLPGRSAVEFERESRVMSRLPHPGIPPVHAFGRLADGRPFLAMKAIRGRTLKEILTARHDPSEDRGPLLATFEQVCQAVGYAHAQGVVHRDLKPDNVMVGAFGEVQVMDWGLAKEFRNAGCGMRIERPEDAGSLLPSDPQSASHTPQSSETVAGQVKGTPAFMAPEQARGEPVDPRADVFALGGILTAILTGQPPFVGDSVRDTTVRAANAELDEAFGRLAGCGADEDLVGLAKWCLSAKAADRPLNGEQVAAAVAAYRVGVDARLRQAERDRAAAEVKADEQRKRRRAQLILAGVVVVALAGAGIAANLILKHQAEDQLRAEQKARVQADVARQNAEKAAEEAQKREEAEKAAAKVAVQAAQADTLIRTLNDLFRSSDPLGAFFGDDIQSLGVTGMSEPLAAALKPFLRSAAERFRETLNTPDAAPTLAKILSAIGNGMKSLGSFPEAKAVLEEALRLRRAHLPNPDADPAVWESELALARLQAEGGDVLSALTRIRRVYALQKAAGADELALLTTRFYEGVALLIIGMPDAGPALRETVAGRQRILGRQHRDTLLAKLALLAWGVERQEWLEVVKMFAEVRADAQTLPDEYMRRGLEAIFDSQERLAKAMMAQTPAGALFSGSLPEAVNKYSESVRRLEGMLPGDHVILCILRFELAKFFLMLNREPEADALFARILSDARKTVGLAHPKLLIFLDAYPARLVANGRAKEARALFEEVERASRERFGDDNPWLAPILLQRARFEDGQGNRPASLERAKEVVDRMRRGKFLASGDTTYQVIVTARILSNSPSRPHQEVAGELLAALRSAVAELHGERSEQVLAVLFHEARHLRTFGAPAAAVERLARARALLPAVTKLPTGLGFAVCYWSGLLELDRGSFDEAEKYLQAAARYGPPSDVDRVELALLRAAVLVGRDRFTDAVPLYEEARRLQSRINVGEPRLALADLQVAAAQLAAGRRKDYLKTLAVMSARYGKSKTVDALVSLGWSSALDHRPDGWDAAAFTQQLAAALKPFPDFGWGWQGLALVRLRAGRFHEVEEALVAAKLPLHPLTHLIRGLNAAAQGDLPGARAALRQAEERVETEKPGPANPFAYLGRPWHRDLHGAILFAELRAAVALPVAPPPRPLPG
jgi:tetratricopeptide (TPR) repeat protein